MEKRILVGDDIFERLIRNNGYYVDKTELLYEIATESRNPVMLITRPRRFGKTLALSMMESFFDVNRDSRELFREYSIARNHPRFCEEWMNQYPVLFLTLKDVDGLDFASAFDMFKRTLSSLCIKHAYLTGKEEVSPADRNTFLRMMNGEASVTDIKYSLLVIMRMMKAVYGKPCILLIDEYDVPLARAALRRNKAFYEQMLDLIRGFLSISLKTNEYLQFAVKLPFPEAQRKADFPLTPMGRPHREADSR